MSGCAAVTNPVANGIPARLLPPELHAVSVENQVDLPLNLLRREPPETYRLAGGDVLGVFIEGVLGQRDQLPPVNFPEAADLPPSLGFPVPVRDDGTVPLPLIPPVKVAGLTVEEAETAVLQQYINRQILVPGKSVIVTLIRPRTIRVLVIRQDQAKPIPLRADVFGRLRSTQTLSTSAEGGTGHIIDLPVGENDVLSALALTGGLPGADAVNEILILRGYYDAQSERFLPPIGLSGQPSLSRDATHSTVRIPLRLAPGAPLPFQPDDLELHSGDIVFIQRREAAYFYTGGLLMAGQHPLPRDYDLTVVEAVTAVGGPILSGAIAGNNLSGTIVAPGIGNPSPSLLAVIRKVPGGQRVVIRVDLNEALREPQEDILVQAGDILMLQEAPDEALGRYFTDVVTLSFVWQIFRTDRASGTLTTIVP